MCIAELKVPRALPRITNLQQFYLNVNGILNFNFIKNKLKIYHFDDIE